MTRFRPDAEYAAVLHWLTHHGLKHHPPTKHWLRQRSE